MDDTSETVGNDVTNADPVILLYDAHCHPTDTFKTVDEIPKLRVAGLCIMATRETDQDLVSTTAVRYSDKVVPCFGFHPWFVHSIYNDMENKEAPEKLSHYESCIYPKPDIEFISAMPELVPLSKYVEDVSRNLEQHPEAMVGEVGLDRSFRIPDPNQPKVGSSRHTLSKYRTETEHQAMILNAQLALAGKYGRACSIHGVQAHGYLFNIISKLWDGQERLSKTAQRKIDAKHKKQKEMQHNESARPDEEHIFESGTSSQSFPPRICLHSYSGTADMLGSWLNPKVPADIFFSFSQVINGRYDRWQEVVSKVPDERILIESDYHDARLIDDSLDEALRFVCKAKDWTEQKGRQQLRSNWMRFVGREKRSIMVLRKGV